MRITVTYNLRTSFNESDAELLAPEDVDRIVTALTELKHQVAPVEVSGKPNDIVERLLESEPDLIFNVAEGTVGSPREAFLSRSIRATRYPLHRGKCIPASSQSR